MEIGIEQIFIRVYYIEFHSGIVICPSGISVEYSYLRDRYYRWWEQSSLLGLCGNLFCLTLTSASVYNSYSTQEGTIDTAI